MATAPLRVMPDFLFIGGNRCGTPTLYEYLCGHPCFAPSVRSEKCMYFDLHFAKGVNWYKGIFRRSDYKYSVTQLQQEEVFTGEATTYYIFHPMPPGRI